MAKETGGELGVEACMFGAQFLQSVLGFPVAMPSPKASTDADLFSVPLSRLLFLVFHLLKCRWIPKHYMTYALSLYSLP